MYRNFGLSRLGYFQRGVAALAISVLLLFVAALILIAVSKTTTMEQRVSGNEIRAIQAHQAAQAGVDHALAYMKGDGTGRGIDRRKSDGTLGSDGIADIITPIPFSENPATYTVTYCDPDPDPDLNCESTPITCGSGFVETGKFSIPLILSCGWSDDRLANKSFTKSSSY